MAYVTILDMLLGSGAFHEKMSLKDRSEHMTAFFSAFTKQASISLHDRFCLAYFLSLMFPESCKQIQRHKKRDESETCTRLVKALKTANSLF